MHEQRVVNSIVPTDMTLTHAYLVNSKEPLRAHKTLTFLEFLKGAYSVALLTPLTDLVLALSPQRNPFLMVDAGLT